MAFSVFDWLKQVTHVKDPWSSFSDEDKATFNPYMLHRFVSMYEPYIDLSNFIQQLWLLNHEQIYLVYSSYLPQNKIFAKYIKSTKSKHKPELLKILATHFQISTREVKDYMVLLSNDDVKHILQSRGMDSTDIDKLIEDEKSTKALKTSS